MNKIIARMFVVAVSVPLLACVGYSHRYNDGYYGGNNGYGNYGYYGNQGNYGGYSGYGNYGNYGNYRGTPYPGNYNNYGYGGYGHQHHNNRPQPGYDDRSPPPPRWNQNGFGNNNNWVIQQPARPHRERLREYSEEQRGNNPIFRERLREDREQEQNQFFQRQQEAQMRQRQRQEMDQARQQQEQNRLQQLQQQQEAQERQRQAFEQQRQQQEFRGRLRQETAVESQPQAIMHERSRERFSVPDNTPQAIQSGQRRRREEWNNWATGRNVTMGCQTISKEKTTVISVIDTNPNKKMISAQRSRRMVHWSKRIDENESTALIINKILSIARALSIRKLTSPGVVVLTMLMTIMHTPTIVAELGKMWCERSLLEL